MGTELIETFRKPDRIVEAGRADEMTPRAGTFATAARKPGTMFEGITLTLGLRTASGAERTVKGDLDRRAAAVLLAELADALGATEELCNAILRDGDAIRNLDRGALFDGVQEGFGR